MQSGPRRSACCVSTHTANGCSVVVSACFALCWCAFSDEGDDCEPAARRLRALREGGRELSPSSATERPQRAVLAPSRPHPSQQDNGALLLHRDRIAMS